MCGIFAYAGERKRSSLDVCIEGLRRLEYRGYDSAGIAGHINNKIVSYKKVGKVHNLASYAEEFPLNLGLTIAHTRWATHGGITEINAHPHSDEHNKIALVHNGIIENYYPLKQELSEKGVYFSTETDTEVIAHLFASELINSPLQALRKTLNRLQGSFALAIIHEDHPETLFLSARECPLAIARNLDTQEIFVSSDTNAFLGKNLQVIFIENDEIVILENGFIQIFDQSNQLIHKKVHSLDIEETANSKNGFDHFMLKEIFEQPTTFKKAIENRFCEKEAISILHFPPLIEERLIKADQLLFVACGTSYHAGCIGSFLVESQAKIPSKSQIASEFRYCDPFLTKQSVVVVISQSGETADTIAALREAKKQGALVISLCNNATSTIAREADHTLLLHAGPEISVCSTKAFTSQLALLSLLVLMLARHRGMSKEDGLLFMQQLRQVPPYLEMILENAHDIEEIANKIAFYRYFLFIGRRLMYFTSLEAALKLKEISYVSAIGYPAGELKHGPMALIDENTLTIALLGDLRTLDKIGSNLKEIEARKGPILAIAPASYKEATSLCDEVIFLPSSITDLMAPFCYTLVTQLLAYYIAKARGENIDQPRNLAKSVTVE